MILRALDAWLGRGTERRLFWALVLLLIMITSAFLSYQMTTRRAAPVPLSGDSTPDAWSLVFDDEFKATSLNTDRWNTCLWWGCTGANGQIDLCFLPQNVVEANGRLTLTATQKSGVCRGGSRYKYASGEIQSGPSGYRTGDTKFALLYGYVEARVKVARGNGFLSGFWMVPSDGDWPPEVDVFEIKGSDPGVAHMTIHWTASRKRLQDHSAHGGPDYSVGWHIFGVDWAPDRLTWYIDGVAAKTVTTAEEIPRQPMDIQATLDVGGSWIGNPDATTAWPGQFGIDYIRAWQRPDQQSRGESRVSTPGGYLPRVVEDQGKMTARSTYWPAPAKRTLRLGGPGRATEIELASVRGRDLPRRRGRGRRGRIEQA